MFWFFFGRLAASMPEPNDAIGSNACSAGDTRRCGAEISRAGTGIAIGGGGACAANGLDVPFAPLVGLWSQPFAVETSDDRSGPWPGGGCDTGAGPPPDSGIDAACMPGVGVVTGGVSGSAAFLPVARGSAWLTGDVFGASSGLS